jgi:sodium transport system ATP-binding protein
MTVSVQDLSKRFFDKARGEFFAVEAVSFSCQPGKIFGLLGPNGAGKTTTLRIISTILKPTTGTVSVAGINSVEHPEEARRKLGFLSADTALYERLTPREVLQFFARLSKYPEDKVAARIEQLITMLAMQTFADTPCEKLSTGMKQKVSIARAIVHDPSVLVFDEPTNGLDVLATQSMHRFIRSCRDDGKTIVFSSHVMSEAEKLCDTIGIIHKGHILGLGTLEELRQKTGCHHLEEIFLAVVGDRDDDSF